MAEHGIDKSVPLFAVVDVFFGARYAEIMAERERANTSGFVKKKVGFAEVEASHTSTLLTL